MCQAKHWGADHKQKCKQITSSNDVTLISGMHKRKSSGVSSISLVPSHGTCQVLPESKKVSDNTFLSWDCCFSVHAVQYMLKDC